MEKYWPKDLIIEFVEVYRATTSLWKIKSQEYKNKFLKNSAYDQLVEVCKRTFPGANREMVTKKIQSMRASFRKELKKIEESSRSGASQDDLYTPTLWYFDILLFTKDHEIPSLSKDSITEDSCDEDKIQTETAKSDGIFKPKCSTAVAAPPVVMRPTPLWELARAAGPWVRLAGISGAAAVVLGAMGAHRTFPAPADSKDDLRKIFDTANRFHFLHSLALVAVPLCRRPIVSGTFMVVGMSLFCGTCYCHAFTGDRVLRQLTPVGGTCLILGWLAMVL